MTASSIRAQIIEARTYLRPLNKEATIFETPEQCVDRVINHQRWLWERAKGGMTKLSDNDLTGERSWLMVPLEAHEEAELAELRSLLLARKVTVSGRTRWLGGTPLSRRIEASQFNCAFLAIHNVYDVVDAVWLLLQGAGVGFKMVPGALNGFSNRMEVEIIRSKRGPEDKGVPANFENYDRQTGVWTIRIGDSSQAWAKSVGKLLAGKFPAKKLVIDFSEIRGAGGRLSSYGWISAGDNQISIAFNKIAALMNARAGKLLTAIDILDVMNWLGTILSSRRSAEIALLDYEHPESEAFAAAKANYFPDNPQRGMSNNSLMFNSYPGAQTIRRLVGDMISFGGSEPGFINAEHAKQRAPWFHGVNPCGEILLGDKSFCNLVETVLCRFNGDDVGLDRAHYLLARANYRQTCVNLDDGVLQRGWHELNEFLRLCGVGVTGVVKWEHQHNEARWEELRAIARFGANSMADELNMPRPKAVTTVKPSGTQSKIMGLVGDEVPEGVHTPMGRFIFNNVRFTKHDNNVAKLKAAGYRVFDDPYNDTDVLVTLPVEFAGVSFEKTTLKDGRVVEIGKESAVEQLERYERMMRCYVDHNCSITVYYSPEEDDDIVSWLAANWSDFVGVSFLFRPDPTMTAADLGYPYLPQEVVTEETFRAYVSTLSPVDITATVEAFDLEAPTTAPEEKECAGGACPIR
jgi:ribonucleoside-triphosphate reductase